MWNDKKLNKKLKTLQEQQYYVSIYEKSQIRREKNIKLKKFLAIKQQQNLFLE